MPNCTLARPRHTAGLAARPKTGYKAPWTPEAFDALMRAETPRVGLWLDTSDMTVAQAADYVLAHAAETRAGATA